jgi:hypothetical protein
MRNILRDNQNQWMLHIQTPLNFGRTDIGPYKNVKVKISLLQAVDTHRVARGQGSHIT